MIFHGKLAIKSMVTPWNYHGQTPWDFMEFSYHFAHMKLPWFAHHGYSMENWTMDIPWNYHGRDPMGCHGIFMVISCGQNDMKIPWKFHGIVL